MNVHTFESLEHSLILVTRRPFIPTPGQPTAADNENEPYVPYYQYLLAKNNSELPQVISNSYADQEDVSFST